MLPQWKLILTNWINCYIDKGSKDGQNLNREALQNIISHLRENLNLDESKSSLLEAHTIQEFLCEKYPKFKFENGTAEAENEDELGLAASLLLFFVCVNSKNLDIKNAMCSKLSSDDQEIILKFSQYLMECPVIIRSEVQTAITEACGQTTAMELPHKHSVAETPPALRSLHSEVRRLQAALDAERFDRNYLQDELARTQGRLDRLLKEKDQHKLDILNLKAKISLCCGEQADARNTEEAADKTAKLTKQLHQLELALEETRVQLNEVMYERDSYKAKIGELKHDRDKWLALSQDEAAKVAQLSEELDTEKRHTQTLRDLVAELRQHNRLNGFDTSSLECDDPDASIHSLPHNSSVCSELCANVVEVQLGEERAKIVVLSQKIQTLQDQINDLSKKAEDEKKYLETVIAQRENDIFNLKHRINEEIEEKNNLKAHCDSEITKLNNEINELDHKYKNYKEHSSSVTEKKMQEIQILQEEKLSLIHSLNSETTKLENKIKGLQSEIESERQARANMKEGYENHMMKLNEKVLNRNNELVELQNSIFEKGEQIETLQIKLKEEREVVDKLKQDYNDLSEAKKSTEIGFRLKSDEVKTLHHKLQQNNKVIEDMTTEIEQLKTSLSALTDNIKQLESAKEQMFNEIKNRDIKLEETLVNVNHMNEVYMKEKATFLQEIDEKNAIVTSLQTQLQDEITFKVALQNELKQEQIAHNALKEEVLKINGEITLHLTEIEGKDRTINSLDLYIQEEKKLKEKAKEKVKEMMDELNQKNDNLQLLKNELDSVNKSLQDETKQFEEYKEVSQKKLLSEVAAKESLNLQLNSVFNEKALADNSLAVKCEEFLLLHDKYNELLQKLEENELREYNLEQDIKAKSETSLQKELEINDLKSKLAELQTLYDKLNEESAKEKESHLKSINSLEKENEQLQFTIKEDNSNYEILISEKNQIIDKLEQQVKENIAKLEDLTRYTEELKISWENSTHVHENTKIALKIKEDKIGGLNEMALNLEQKINEVEQEKGELSKTISIMEENLARKETELSYLVTEKENIASENRFLLTEKEKLTKILAEEEANKKIIENENIILLSEKEELTREKAILSNELDMILKNEITTKNIATEESNKLQTEIVEMKRKLNEEIEKTVTLLQEKECLTQYLNEEVSLKKITEKEKEYLIAEKLLLKEKNANYEQEINTLNNNIKILNQNIKEDNDTLIHLKHENDNMTAELAKQKSLQDQLLNENQCLRTDSDRLKVEIININSAKDNLKAEKELLESALQKEKCTRDEIVTEKNELSIKVVHKLEENNTLTEEYDKLTKRYEGLKLEQDILIKEKESILQDMNSANEILKTEKEQAQAEKMALVAKLELELMNKHEKISNMSKEIEELNFVLAEQKNNLESLKSERDFVISEKDILIATLGIEKCAKEKLSEEIDKLNAILAEEKSKLESVIRERDSVISEKDTLVKSLNAEKCAKDELQLEKKHLENVLDVLNTKYEKLDALNNKIEANCKMNVEKAGLLETGLQGVQETVRNGFKKLVQKLKSEDINNDILQELINDNNIDYLQLSDTLDLLLNVTEVLASDVLLKEKLEVSLKNENVALSEMQEVLKKKEAQVFELQTDIKRLEQAVHENKIEQTKQSETYVASMNSKIKDIHTLQEENKSLHNDLNDVKVQLEIKVHSLKEKLVESELLTDKLKKSYDCQIDNLNVMITKLSNYLKEKTVEIDAQRKEKEQLQETLGDNCKVIQTLEEDVKTEKQNMEKIISDFESERQVLKNMVTVTESVMEDQKITLTKTITEHLKTIEKLSEKNKELKNSVQDLEIKLKSHEMAHSSLLTLLRLERKGKEAVEKESENVREYLDEVINYLYKERNSNTSVISALEFQEKILTGDYEKMKYDLESVQKKCEELKMSTNNLQSDLTAQGDMLTKVLDEKVKIETALQEKENDCSKQQIEVKELKNKMNDVIKEKNDLEQEKSKCLAKIEEYQTQLNAIVAKDAEEIAKLKMDNQELLSKIEELKTVITDLRTTEQRITYEIEENNKICCEIELEKAVLTHKCTLIEDSQAKSDIQLQKHEHDNITLRNQIEELQTKIDLYDTIISTTSKELAEEKAAKEKYERDLETQKAFVNELKNNMEIRALKKENEQLIRVIGQKETFTALCQETTDKYGGHMELRDQQVDNPSDIHTVESKTITDLEKIVHDRNRTITTLQTDISYMKTLMAESETKLLDVSRELEVTKENCQQLSGQLKKIVYQKNEEIAELKKQVNKLSVNENRATQIIKVSAKYQAMILKRIAEIKSNTVLKELTNLGSNCDNEVRRSLAGSVTMEDLENFLETTDRHLKRCAEKQISLQKERDRLAEVNRINESEIINIRKFLTELSVSFQTFTSLKEMYSQKLSRVISVQRTVRREILSLDGRITEVTMCKLERGYGAAMQDLVECTMNLERWVERCISRTVSIEKIKQAFTSDNDRLSLSTPTFQNTGLEIQLEELEKLFQKLLEEVARAIKGDGVKDEKATTIMEVRAEYEDKLNRMKAKMKDLFNEQMAVLKNKQRDDIALLERELQKTRDRMEESKRAYETHIKDLTKELWTMSEKFLVKNDEAQWLKRKQKSGSLMSLQHVHSSGLVSHQEPPSRPSDAHSLRSLPVNDNNTTTKRAEGRGLHMSDEEGELFDNRYLKELSTPRRNTGHRLSELKWRNSLCPPHLKSSYPAETQFAAVLDEDDIKAGSLGPVGSRSHRKEVGITAYKKPGPPTPSKQAGRLSATDSELRESLRVETEPTNERKTSTPARFRAFLRFNKNDTNEGTPRARRLSNIFRKKQ